jgi:hypothetical protein
MTMRVGEQRKGVGDQRFLFVLLLLFVTDPFIPLWASKEKERGRAPPSAFKTTPPTGGTKRYSA